MKLKFVFRWLFLQLMRLVKSWIKLPLTKELITVFNCTLLRMDTLIYRTHHTRLVTPLSIGRSVLDVISLVCWRLAATQSRRSWAMFSDHHHIHRVWVFMHVYSKLVNVTAFIPSTGQRLLKNKYTAELSIYCSFTFHLETQFSQNLEFVIFLQLF